MEEAVGVCACCSGEGRRLTVPGGAWGIWFVAVGEGEQVIVAHSADAEASFSWGDRWADEVAASDGVSER